MTQTPSSAIIANRFQPVAPAPCLLGEGPRWNVPERSIYWIDIEAGALFRQRDSEPRQTVVQRPHRIGSYAFTSGGRIVLATELGFELFDPATGLIQTIGNSQPDRQTRFNDGRVDPAGRFWAGTMALDPALYAAPMGRLYCLHADGRIEEKLAGLTISNGIDWSPDGRVMYLIDTMRGEVLAFDFDTTRGALSNRRIFARLRADEGYPDGLAIDCEGCLWIAVICGGELRRYSPEGALLCQVPTGTPWPTAVAFGGADLASAYVTTSRHLAPADNSDPWAGALLGARLGIQGRAETLCALTMAPANKETSP